MIINHFFREEQDHKIKQKDNRFYKMLDEICLLIVLQLKYIQILFLGFQKEKWSGKGLKETIETNGCMMKDNIILVEVGVRVSLLN